MSLKGVEHDEVKRNLGTGKRWNKQVKSGHVTIATDANDSIANGVLELIAQKVKV